MHTLDYFFFRCTQLQQLLEDIKNLQLKKEILQDAVEARQLKKCEESIMSHLSGLSWICFMMVLLCDVRTYSKSCQNSKILLDSGMFAIMLPCNFRPVCTKQGHSAKTLVGRHEKPISSDNVIWYNHDIDNVSYLSLLIAMVVPCQ